MSSQDDYHSYLQSDYWLAVSAAVKERDVKRCKLCNSPFNLIAHHRTYEHRGNELRFLDDLVYLCGRCHDIFHNIPRVDDKHPGIALAEKRRQIESVPVAIDRMVLITEKNFKLLRCTKEPWHWMVEHGIDPTKKGWAKRAIGFRVPQKFLR
jgi:hypothetical protein